MTLVEENKLRDVIRGFNEEDQFIVADELSDEVLIGALAARIRNRTEKLNSIYNVLMEVEYGFNLLNK